MMIPEAVLTLGELLLGPMAGRTCGAVGKVLGKELSATTKVPMYATEHGFSGKRPVEFVVPIIEVPVAWTTRKVAHQLNPHKWKVRRNDWRHIQTPVRHRACLRMAAVKAPNRVLIIWETQPGSVAVVESSAYTHCFGMYAVDGATGFATST